MSETADSIETKGSTVHWTRTPTFKIMGVLGLFVAMLVPQFLTSGLIHEREQRQDDVLATFRRGWGPEQVVSGPVLVVPYASQSPLNRDGRSNGVLRLAASHLDVTATLDPQRRRRGLFQATIYSAAVAMSGVVAVPPVPYINGNPADLDWGSARVVINTSSLRGMQPDQTMEWGGATAPMQPDAVDGCEAGTLMAPANLSGPPAPGTAIPFKVALTLRGTQAFHVAPTARQTMMRVASAWPTPGFTGANLPISYTANPTGFDAQWDVAGDPARAGWQSLPACSENQTSDEAAGVALQEAVPTYAMVDRTAKYGMFFLALAYLTLFLFEALSRVRVHLVQYGLIGLSVSLFALLLISIAEPLGFAAAYALSATAVIAQASLYTLSVVGRARLAGIFAGVLAALFAFIYVVLSLDSYALLAGTIALFAILCVLMAATRRVSWAA